MDKFKNQLKKWCDKNGMPVKESSPKKKQKKNEEKLSRYEIEELMGTNRRIHKRGRGGALR